MSGTPLNHGDGNGRGHDENEPTERYTASLNRSGDISMFLHSVFSCVCFVFVFGAARDGKWNMLA